MIAEYNGSTGALIWEYIYGGGRMLARDQGGVMRYYLQDRLSTRVISDGNGAVVGTEDQMPFGDDPLTGTGEAEKHRFTSYERDSESGTDYAVNRQYSYSTGRYLRPDPVQGSIDNPQSLNRYSYSLNDPVNLIDPLGLFGVGVGVALAKAVDIWRYSGTLGSVRVTADYNMSFIPWALGMIQGGGPIGQRELPIGRGLNDFLPLIPPAPLPQRPDCFSRVASIFGGPGAVGGDHRASPGRSNSDPIAAAKAHVYPSANGSGQTNIYVPAGFDYGVFVGQSNSTAYFYYGANGLFGNKNVTLLVQHLANPNLGERNRFQKGPVENGRVQIGTTGGLDGGQVNGPNYQHAHIEVFRGSTLPALVPGAGENQQTARNNARIPYRDVFCK